MPHYLVAVHVLLFLLKEKNTLCRIETIIQESVYTKQSESFPYFLFSNLMNILLHLPPMLTLALGFIVFRKLEYNLELLIGK